MGWGFDIAALRNLLERMPTPPREVRVPVPAAARLLESDPVLTPAGARVVPVIGVDVSWEHVDELSNEVLELPLFLAPMGQIGHLVIDGWHRIALARRLGLADLPGLLLTRQQASRVLVAGSRPLPPDKPDHDKTDQ